MLHEDLRYLHEDIERLEQAIADRVLDDPKHIRNRLIRDHEISSFLQRIQDQSQRALNIYNTQQEALTSEVQQISTGDPFESFYSNLNDIKDFHKRYPNEPVENLERAYNKNVGVGFAGDVDGMFTGEEAFGRFFDLTLKHDEYLNLPRVKDAKKLTYLQYLDNFDNFSHYPMQKDDKMTELYFSYVTSLAQYMESFMRRIKPLEDLQNLFKSFDDDFEKSWQEEKVEGWEQHAQSNGAVSGGPVTEGTGEGVWCPDCEKEFKNDGVYKAHLSGKKHIRNAEARKQQPSEDTEMSNGITSATSTSRLKEKAIAEKEHRVKNLAGAMKTEREDTRVNVERKAGMTDRERQQELAALYAEDIDETNGARGQGDNEDGEEDDEEKIYNPLKLPLAWDGKPIPFWLYKLHGLGVEFSCEICGNYVYMGRRAFDKHFGEARHIYGLKCLGVGAAAPTTTSDETTGTTTSSGGGGGSVLGLFRGITRIEEAEKLWEKIQRDREKVKEKGEGIVQMEDSEGNVMPERVWKDLERAGLL